MRLAIEEGAELVPVYAFGESDLWGHSTFMLGARKYIQKKFSVAIPLLYGQFGIMPYRHPVTMVFGTPIKVPHTPKPSEEQVDAAHEQYCAALQALFDKYKARCGYPDAQLEMPALGAGPNTHSRLTVSN